MKENELYNCHCESGYSIYIWNNDINKWQAVRPTNGKPYIWKTKEAAQYNRVWLYPFVTSGIKVDKSGKF